MGLTDVRSYQIKIEDFSVGSSDRGKNVLKRLEKSRDPKRTFEPHRVSR